MRVPMRPFVVLAVAALTAATIGTKAPPQPRMSLIAEIGGDSACDEVAHSPRAKLLACSSWKGDLRVYDVDRRTVSVVLQHVYAGDVAWSPAGDRLVFYWWKEDGGDEYHIWTVAVDPRTGQAAGQPRRVSVSAGSDPSFSPDGRAIAFAALRPRETQRRLTVIPAEGGSERVLVTGDISGPYSWTPDGKWIYYVQNAAQGRGIYRIAVAGGRPERVTSGTKYFNGLSPDGQNLLAVRPSVDGFTATVMDVNGRALGTALLATDLHDGTGSGYGWLSQPLHFLLNRTLQPTTLRAVDIASGKVTELASAAERPWAPSWSADGRRIAVRLWNGTRRDLAVMNADGSGRRFLHLGSEPVSPMSFDSWSPDGRYIAYWRPDTSAGATSPGFKPEALYVIDVETGAEKKLVRAPTGHGNYRWSADSRRIRYVHRGVVPGGAKGEVHVSFHEVTLSGVDRLLRDIGVRVTPGWLFTDNDRVLDVSNGVAENVTGGQSVKLFDATKGRPGISSDGKWIAHTPNGVGGPAGPASYELISADAKTRSTVTLPATLHSTIPVVAPDGRFLYVPNGNTGYDNKPPTAPAQIIVVPTNGDAPRTLVSLPKGEVVGLNMATLSPDGRTLLYVGQGQATQSYYDVDFSSVIASSPPKLGAKP